MPSDGWDFQVQRIDLDGLDVDATNRLGMVIVQPEYGLEPNTEPSFRISRMHRESQCDLIKRAFQIRAAESKERDAPIPFIVFPELAIPVTNPNGLDCLCQQMEHAKGEVIFIGGLESLSPQEAHGVAALFKAERPDFSAGSFVNLCVIVVKLADGQVRWHFQAKLRPSKWEQLRSMACGQQVLYFVAPKITFLCQICFDHIAQDGKELLNDTLCHQLIETTRPNAASLDFLFLLQYNPKPNDPSFRLDTSLLVNFQDRLLQNSRTAIVAVNKAADLQESSQFGRSGFHYAAGRWQVPATDIGPKGYELYDLNNVTSAVFRKRTPAIHVATLVPPLHNIGNVGNARLPLECARSYLTGNGCDSVLCAHLPGSKCDAGTYVECDCVPCKLRDGLLEHLPTTDKKVHRWKGSDSQQSTLIELHYGKIRQRLLALNCQRAVEFLNILFFAHKDRNQNPDTWQELAELDAVCEFAAAMSVLRERSQIDFKTEACWTAMLGDWAAVAVLDGDNSLNCHDIATKYLQQHGGYPLAVRSIPVLIVALRSTGRVTPFVETFQPDITKSRTQLPCTDNSPYEPARVRTFLCRDDLFQVGRRAHSLKDFLDKQMEVVCG